MDHEERRAHKRYYDGERNDTFLELVFENTKFRFYLLSSSVGGMGMLVMNDCSEVLKSLKIGGKIDMKYCTPEKDMFMSFIIRHVTQMKNGPYEGHYQVGLSL